MEKLTREYVEVLQGKQGTMNYVHAQPNLHEGTSPQFCHSCRVSFAIRESVSRELDHMEAAGIMENVEC